MKVYTALFAAASAVLSACPAAANTFDGPYVGAAIGWSRDEIDDSIEGLPIDGEIESDSFNLAAYVGYNYLINDRFLIGAEAGINASTSDDEDFTTNGRPADLNPRTQFDISARLGYVVSEKGLLYVRGGYSNARVRIRAIDANGDLFRISENLDGYNLGGGGEYALTDNITARLEYRYNDLGNNGGDYDRHQVLVGASYNF